MLVRGVVMRDPEDAVLVDSLLASQHREARVPLAEAPGKLEFARARLAHGDVSVLLAQLDERPAGLAAYLVHEDIAFIRKLYVPEFARSQGVATALLYAVAERTAAPLLGLFASTAGRLPEFYRARGFAGVTRRETWLRDADAVLDGEVTALGELEELEGLEGVENLEGLAGLGQAAGYPEFDDDADELTLPKD
jgi:GNAT superfamily N-acetyltransferase